MRQPRPVASGYAAGFAGVLAYINGLLPRNEHIGQAFREERPVFPEIAIRELVANALIHQPGVRLRSSNRSAAAQGEAEEDALEAEEQSARSG